MGVPSYREAKGLVPGFTPPVLGVSLGEASPNATPLFSPNPLYAQVSVQRTAANLGHLHLAFSSRLQPMRRDKSSEREDLELSETRISYLRLMTNAVLSSTRSCSLICFR